jgi:hypothetical protein
MLSDEFMTSRINARAFAEVEREAELRRRAAERREALRSAEAPVLRAAESDAPAVVVDAPEPVLELAHAGR